MFANPTDEHENLNPMNSCLSWTKRTLTSQWSHPQGLISCWTRVSKFFLFLGYQVFDQLPKPGIGTSKIVPDSFTIHNCYLTTSSSHKGVILDTKALVGTKGRGLVVTYFFSTFPIRALNSKRCCLTPDGAARINFSYHLMPRPGFEPIGWDLLVSALQPLPVPENS